MGKKHPLDIFRTSDGGFDSASRQRRTLPGKVVASTPRPGAESSGTARAGSPHSGTAGSGASGAAGTRAAPLISAARAAAAARAEERAEVARTRSSAAIAATPARSAGRFLRGASDGPGSARAPRTGSRPSANRILLYSALGLIGVLALYLVGANQSGATALKSSTVFSAGPHAGAGYTVRVATWAGSEAGRAAAVASRDELVRRGFPSVTVLGYPAARPGEFASFDLLAGVAATKADLQDLLAAVSALKSGSGDAPAFKDARIVSAPTTAPR